MFGFLYDIQKLSSMKNDIVLQKCLSVERALQAAREGGICGSELHEELQLPRKMEGVGAMPLDTVKMVTGLCDTFLGVCVVLRTVLTMLVSVASTERSFSKPKLIKNYLCSATSHERLDDLASLCTENEYTEAFYNVCSTEGP